MGQQVFVAGRWFSGEVWGLMGIFTTQEAAEAACTAHTDFVGPVTLDMHLLETPEDWPGVYYPRVPAVENA